MGIGDWGLGIGDWGLGPIPNPQSPYKLNNLEFIFNLNNKLNSLIKIIKKCEFILLFFNI